MTKQEILDSFNDIDFVYNDSSKHDTLSRMIDELLSEQSQIVRCKDCKHFTEPDENGFGVCMKIMHGCQSWGFCADGERKSE